MPPKKGGLKERSFGNNGAIMYIKRYEKRQDGLLEQNAICKDLDSSSCCIHNDSERVLIFSKKVKIEESFYVCDQQVLFCPYCGYSYQPELLDPEKIFIVQHVTRINHWLEIIHGTPDALSWDKFHSKKDAYELYKFFKSQPESIDPEEKDNNRKDNE